MGITGLLPFLNDASRTCNIDEFRGCTAVIDTYSWLHKGAFACADKLFRGEDTNMYVAYCMKYVNLLKSLCIKPILVFDGQHLPAKKDTEEKRRELRRSARLRGKELLRLGKHAEALRFIRQCVDITHEMALALIKECRKNNVDCIVAPYEADAQMAYLNLQGIAEIVITEDSDLVLFGCTKMVYKLNLTGFGILIEKEKLIKSMRMRPNLYTFDKFRHMCILSGCDYLDSLPGIGLKRAHKAVTLTHDPNIYNLLPRLPRYLNLKHLEVSPDYIEKFKLAEAALKHQIVYDPLKRQLVHLTSPDACGTDPEHLKNVGVMYDAGMAFQMALGNIDPISLRVLDDWNPDDHDVPESSIWSKRFVKSNSYVRTRFLSPTKNKAVLNIDVNSSITSEQEKMDFDEKLDKELQVYRTTNLEAIKPQSKPEEDENLNEDENLKDVIKQMELNNPFLRPKAKPLSKFGATNLEAGKGVKSRFFKEKTDDLENVIVQKSTSDKSRFENSVNLPSCTVASEVQAETESEPVLQKFVFVKPESYTSFNQAKNFRASNSFVSSSHSISEDDSLVSKFNKCLKKGFAHSKELPPLEISHATESDVSDIDKEETELVIESVAEARAAASYHFEEVEDIEVLFTEAVKDPTDSDVKFTPGFSRKRKLLSQPTIAEMFSKMAKRN